VLHIESKSWNIHRGAKSNVKLSRLGADLSRVSAKGTERQSCSRNVNDEKMMISSMNLDARRERRREILSLISIFSMKVNALELDLRSYWQGNGIAWPLPVILEDMSQVRHMEDEHASGGAGWSVVRLKWTRYGLLLRLNPALFLWQRIVSWIGGHSLCSCRFLT